MLRAWRGSGDHHVVSLPILSSQQRLITCLQEQHYQGYATTLGRPRLPTNTSSVVARFRPQNKIELASGGQPVVNFESDDSCNVTVGGGIHKAHLAQCAGH